jgi:hypothetical protein
MPRTQGSGLPVDAATIWTAVLPPSYRLPSSGVITSGRTHNGVFVVRSRAVSARTSLPAVEQYSTTVLPIRERATEGWCASTLTTKES